jgi:hypothetical protein
MNTHLKKSSYPEIKVSGRRVTKAERANAQESYVISSTRYVVIVEMRK